MKVLIITESGKDIGFGHITRCTSIYQAFEEFGIQPQFIVNGDETVPDLLKDRNCRVFDWLNDRKTLFTTVKNADIVFVDSYLADYDLYEKVSNIAETAKKHNLVLIEDACHALGAKYLDTNIGDCEYSDMAVFSFHPVKSITTGEGGAVLTNNEDYYKKLVMFRHHGVTKESGAFQNKGNCSGQ